MKRARDPQTPEQWQLAVDAAAGLRALYDCKLYGLLEGPGLDCIDAARCDELLAAGAVRGIRPSAPDAELAMRMTRALMGGET